MRDRQPLMQMVEEATALLRDCTGGTWLWYFIGTCPFICAVLHFWNDMTRSGDAHKQLPRAALIVALTYIGMKTAHAIFADRLMQQLRGDSRTAPIPFRGKLRLVSSQALIHATMPVVLPLAGMALVPTAWVYAFYHSATTLAAGHFRNGGNTRGLLKVAIAQSHFRPGPNHAVMLIILVFGMLMWMNLFGGILITSQLLKSFTGTENEFTRNPMMAFDTGFIATTILLAYLLTAPLVRALYALRCFQGLSRKNGEDLLAQIRALGTPIKTAIVMAVMFFSSLGANAQPSANQAMRPDQIEQKIQDVLKEDMFRWRMPKEDLASAEMGPISSFVRDLFNSIRDGAKSISKSIQDLWRRLFPDREADVKESVGEASTWANSVEMIVYVLVAALAVMLIIIAWKQWRAARLRPVVAKSSPPPIDLQDEQVVASQLPENEWLKLAEEKIEAGELRLALRALFLASLAFLGERRLIAISRSKSNGDYVRELGFRARERSEMRACFGDNVRSFDRAWYGWHEVTLEALDHFRGNHQRISNDGPPR